MANFESLFTGNRADIGIIADGLGDDIPGTLEGFFDRFHIFIQIGFLDDVCDISLGKRLLEDMVRQTLQASFTSDHGASAALGFIRGVQVLEGSHGLRCQDGGFELIREFALLFDGSQDSIPALLDLAQADDFICHDPDLLIIKGAGHFLAITGDERDSIAFVQQTDGGLHLGGFDFYLVSQ